MLDKLGVLVGKLPVCRIVLLKYCTCPAQERPKFCVLASEVSNTRISMNTWRKGTSMFWISSLILTRMSCGPVAIREFVGCIHCRESMASDIAAFAFVPRAKL